jgi:predicted amidohydrolase YtcJ
MRFAPALAFAITLLSAPAGGRTLFHGGTVFTGHGSAPDATWFIVDADRFVVAGNGDPDPRIVRPDDVRVDLGGRFVAPGFIDAHLHFVDGGLSLLQENLNELRTPEQVASALAAAGTDRLGEWVVARGLGLEPFSGRLPAHGHMEPLLGDLAHAPVWIALKGGHHVWVSRAGLSRLGIDRSTKDPDRGRIHRGPDGEPTGLLEDEAAWTALRKVYAELPLETIGRAMLLAQRKALAYGITTVGDNTFFPHHARLFWRLIDGGHFRLRVALRSFGSVPVTRFLMRPTGVDFFGNRDPRISFLGEKHFMDAALSLGGVSGAGAKMTAEETRDAFLFAAPYGVALHTQSREGIERVLAAFAEVAGRVPPDAPIIVDHCGSCGGDGTGRLKALDLRVTVLPGQLHDLPEIARDNAPERLARLMPIRELFAGGVRPALTSDWPHGAEATYPGLHDALGCIGLSPLCQVAVVTSGRTPAGAPIALAESRTIGVGDALLGYTANGARAVGREHDLGRIGAGYLADFVVLERSPFEGDLVAQYTTPVAETWIAGERVYPAAKGAAVPHTDPAIGAAAHDNGGRILGVTPSPIIGYDPVPGFLLGGALFLYPFEESGFRGSGSVIVAVEQGTVLGELSAAAVRLLPRLSLDFSARVETFRGRYYGFGADTPAAAVVGTEPIRAEGSAGGVLHLSRRFDLGVRARYGFLAEGAAAAIEAAGGKGEGPVEGHASGVRVEVTHDDRDSFFSPRRGGRRALWAEAWLLQASQLRRRGLVGVSATQFIPLYAPDLVLALRAEGAASVGAPSYQTNVSLGGAERLRGYLSNRFRGHHFVAATVELRYPIWRFVSGVAFAETGQVFAAGIPFNPSKTAVSGGAGLRFGLPPDQAIKLRFDGGFSKDQWGIFFQFDEAF